jgi:FlaA1/EpsC-like NDP-sugar epimerase/lipopolysaccharide/colanic/teichoic acid biosynthesis glycosyltransferase/ActR/RegA family two-component response regulator
MLRRSVDLMLSLVTLVLLTPVFVLVAIVIKLDSPGPVLYSQARVGRKGRLFKVHKFRSMVVDAEQVGPPLTGSADPRITQVGTWLRWLKLDELPQFINVLTGDMSLVGPRPEVPSIVEQYTSEQREILEVKPGITGPTQLAWIDESDKFPVGVDPIEHYAKQFMQEKLKSDLGYIRTCSVADDLWYVILTPVAIGRRILATLNRPLTVQKCARLALDGLAIAAANLLAFMFRFDWALPEKEVQHLFYGLPIVCAAYLLSFLALRTHRSIWRFAGIEDLRQIIKAAALGGGLHGFALVLLGWYGYPRSVLLMTPFLTVLLAGGVRLLVRLRAERQATASPSTNGRRKVVIIGAGETGELIAREILGNPSLDYSLIGFLDDDPQKYGATIHSRPVLGAIEGLSDIAKTYAIDEAIIAISTANGNVMRRIGSMCARAGLPFKTLPSFTQLVRGDGKLRYLRKVNVDDLLGREPVSVNREAIASCLRGKRVMVTGAGGSIGAELCRQLISYGVQSLIMVERAENALHDISLEITERCANVAVTTALADIKHIPRMSELFERSKPQVIFHAAAYKHVPILEGHPAEAVMNNVVGTKRLIDLARRFAVETFIFISTDKAVNPGNLMGATKKICEMYITALSNTACTDGIPVGMNVQASSSSSSSRVPSECGEEFFNVTPRHFGGEGEGGFRANFPLSPLYKRGVGGDFDPSESDATQFRVVRFGNVLGSAGSVVPLFQRQVENGGSISITDPDATRFFMTIPEAVGLVLESTTLEKRGDVFVLNMGVPVKITELARDLVVSLGLSPTEVIQEHVGLRPGEKMHEALWEEREEAVTLGHGRIFAIRQHPKPLSELEACINEMEHLAMSGNCARLLRKVQEVVPSYTPPENVPLSVLAAATERYRVVVVDDNEQLCETLEEFLAVNDMFTVTTAHTAQEGFDRIVAEAPHLILLDVKLPDRSGLELCQQLRAHPVYSRIPIIMITGYGEEIDAIPALQSGADDYLRKPFRLEELRARIEAVLRRAGTVQSALPVV